MSAGAFFECERCKGRGEILPSKYSLEDYIKCPDCNGEGGIFVGCDKFRK